MPISGILGRQLFGTFGLGSPNSSGGGGTIVLVATLAATSSESASTVNVMTATAAGTSAGQVSLLGQIGATSAATSAATATLLDLIQATTAGVSHLSVNFTGTIPLSAFMSAVSSLSAMVGGEAITLPAFTVGAPRGRWQIGRPHPMRMSVLSTEYVKIPVSPSMFGVSYNPTSDPVFMAFPATNAAPTTWYAATWETAVTGGNTTFFADCLVGPLNGGLTLPVGIYQPWIKVTDNPEVPTIPATFTLTIY